MDVARMLGALKEMKRRIKLLMEDHAESRILQSTNDRKRLSGADRNCSSSWSQCCHHKQREEKPSRSSRIDRKEPRSKKASVRHQGSIRPPAEAFPQRIHR